MPLRRNAVANYVGQGWTTLMGLAFIPLYIRFLGVEAYGLIGIFALLQTWMSLLDLGLTPAISREMARFTAGGRDPSSMHELLRSVELTALALCVAGAIVVAASSHWLATSWLQNEALSNNVVAQALMLMGVVVALRFLENLYRGCLVGLQRQVPLNVVLSSAATLRSVGAVACLAFISPTIIVFFVWQGVVSLATVVALAAIAYRALPVPTTRPSFSANALRQVWKFAAGTALVTILGFMLSQADKVLLSKLLSLDDFALYTLAYTITSAARLLALPLDQAVFPRLAELYQHADERALAALYHKSAQYNAVIVGSVGLFLALFGAPVLSLWLQNDDLAARTYAVVWILALGMILNAMMNGPYYLQLAAGWTGLLVKVNAVLVVVFIPAIYLLTARYRMVGAAVAWVLLNGVYMLVVARLMHQRLLRGEMKRWYVHDVFIPLAAAAGVGAVLRQLAPTAAGLLPTIVFLAVALGVMLLAAALAAGRVREQLTGQFAYVFGRSA